MVLAVLTALFKKINKALNDISVSVFFPFTTSVRMLKKSKLATKPGLHHFVLKLKKNCPSPSSTTALFSLVKSLIISSTSLQMPVKPSVLVGIVVRCCLQLMTSDRISLTQWKTLFFSLCCFLFFLLR